MGPNMTRRDLMLFDAIASLADAPTRLPPESVDSYLPQGIPIVAGVEASRGCPMVWFVLST